MEPESSSPESQSPIPEDELEQMHATLDFLERCLQKHRHSELVDLVLRLRAGLIAAAR